MASPPSLRILYLIYPGFNVLDMVGPLDVFSSSTIKTSPTYSATVASATALTTSIEALIVQRQISFSDLLGPSSEGGPLLSQFDMILVPGAGPDAINAALDAGDIVPTIRKFIEAKDGRQRWLVSVCTGAMFLGQAGVLRGKVATTHWAHFGMLGDIRARVEGAGKGESGTEKGTEIVRARVVDAGEIENGVKIITAGGVACGIDAGLWIVSKINGVEVAKKIAEGMDYAWAEGEVVDMS